MSFLLWTKMESMDILNLRKERGGNNAMKSNVLKRVLASSLMMVMLTGVLACGSPAKQASETEGVSAEEMGILGRNR